MSDCWVNENHNLTHIPFRNWCIHCLIGGAVNLSHFRGGEEQQEVLVSSMDYMWMKGKEGEEAGDNPILVMTDRRSKWRAARVMKRKGRDGCIIKRVCDEMRKLRCNGIDCKSDQEGAELTVRQAVDK